MNDFKVIESGADGVTIQSYVSGTLLNALIDRAAIDDVLEASGVSNKQRRAFVEANLDSVARIAADKYQNGAFEMRSRRAGTSYAFTGISLGELRRAGVKKT